MRILHIVPSYKPAYIYGGPIESIAKLCEALVKRGKTVEVYTTTANGATELLVIANKLTDVNGVAVTYFNRITKDPTHLSPRLWRQLYLTCRNYDVVHIHSWWNPLVIVAAMICHAREAKVIISPRGMLSDYILSGSNSAAKKWIHRSVGKKALRKSWFHATSQIEFEECKALIPNWKGFNLPNLIHLPYLPLQKREHPIFTLGFLSRIDPKKGLPFIFEAIAQLNFPLIFRIAGQGEEKYIQELKRLAIQLHIEDKIEWLGWKGPEEKFEALMSFDLFVLSSFNENFANVVIESLHAGTPVCISRYVGLASFVEASDLGWVTDLTADALAEAITDAYHNSAKRKRIEATARNIVKTNFSEDVVIGKYLDMYEEVVRGEKSEK